MNSFNERFIISYANEKSERYQREAEIRHYLKPYSLRHHLAIVFARLAQWLEPKRSQETYNPLKLRRL